MPVTFFLKIVLYKIAPLNVEFVKLFPSNIAEPNADSLKLQVSIFAWEKSPFQILASVKSTFDRVA